MLTPQTTTPQATPGPPRPTATPPRPIGLIAGQGQLPILVARGIRGAGRRVCAIGLAGQYRPELPQVCDCFRTVGVARLGQWIRTLRGWGVEEAVMIGRVAHDRKHQRFVWLRYAPDWRAFRLWYRVLRHDRRTATVLTALADELERNGVRLIDNRAYLADHLATLGPMTRTAPDADLWRDVEFGWPLMVRAAELNVGQALAVRNRDVIAVEAAEGTDRMIERAGELAKGRPWVLLKTSAPSHDVRADVATVGVETVLRLHAAGGRAMVLGVGRVIMADRPAVIAEAERLGVAILGRELA